MTSLFGSPSKARGRSPFISAYQAGMDLQSGCFLLGFLKFLGVWVVLGAAESENRRHVAPCIVGEQANVDGLDGILLQW